MSYGDGPASMYKLTILGDGGVGKTALTIQLCLNQFVETYDPTIEDSYRKRIILDGEPTTLEVLDTAGQEEYTALRDQWIRDGEGFLIVYSITHRRSFSHVMPYYQQILRVKDGEPFGCVLVGNKVDKADERQVSVQEGEKLAKDLGIPFFETSAKLNINAEHAFLTAAQITRERRFEDQGAEEAPLNGLETSTNESGASSPSVLRPVSSTSHVGLLPVGEGDTGPGVVHAPNSPNLRQPSESKPQNDQVPALSPLTESKVGNSQPTNAQKAQKAAAPKAAAADSTETPRKQSKKKSKKVKCIIM